MKSLNSVLNVRNHLIEIVGNSNEVLIEWVNEITKLEQASRDAVLKFVKTEHPSYKVARKFLDRDNSGNFKVSKNEALVIIHSALYRVQELSSFLSLEIYPDAVEIHTVAKDLIRSKEIQLMNDEKLLSLGLSKTDQKREVEFIMNNMVTNFEKIDMKFKQIKNIIQFVEFQNSALNRLDSALRLKQNIDSTVAFETIAKGGNIELID